MDHSSSWLCQTASSENIIINVDFGEPGPPPQLMIGAFPPEQSAESVLSILSTGWSQYLTYLPAFPTAQVSITPSMFISLSGNATRSYDLEIQWTGGGPPDNGNGNPPAPPPTFSLGNGDAAPAHTSSSTSTSSLSSSDPDGGNPDSSTSLNTGGITSGLFAGFPTSTSTGSSPTSGGPPDTETSPTPPVTSPLPSNSSPGSGPPGDPNPPGRDGPHRHPNNGPEGPDVHEGLGGRGEPKEMLSPQPSHRSRPSRRHPSRGRGPHFPDQKVMNSKSCTLLIIGALTSQLCLYLKSS
jgi:hypothetical protein